MQNQDHEMFLESALIFPYTDSARYGCALCPAGVVATPTRNVSYQGRLQECGEPAHRRVGRL